MTYVPDTTSKEPVQPAVVPTIIVHAMKENKRPVGFAPWPERPKRKKKLTPAVGSDAP